MPTTTTNMLLTTWPNLGDFFNHTDLSNNFNAIDAHDHSTGKGVSIPAAGLASNAVTTSKINDGAVTASKLAANSVTQAKLDSAFGALVTGYASRLSMIGAANTLATAAATVVPFDTVMFSTDTGMNVGGQPTRLYAPVTGAYRVSASITLAAFASASGFRTVNLRVNGSTSDGSGIMYGRNRLSGSTNADTFGITTLLYLTAGQYVDVTAFQNSGSTLAYSNTECSFSMEYASAP